MGKHEIRFDNHCRRFIELDELDKLVNQLCGFKVLCSEESDASSVIAAILNITKAGYVMKKHSKQFEDLIYNLNELKNQKGEPSQADVQTFELKASHNSKLKRLAGG